MLWSRENDFTIRLLDQFLSKISGSNKNQLVNKFLDQRNWITHQKINQRRKHNLRHGYDFVVTTTNALVWLLTFPFLQYAAKALGSLQSLYILVT